MYDSAQICVITCIARGSGQVQAVVCDAPAGRSDFAAELILLSFFLAMFDRQATLGIPMKLADIGMRESDLERAARLATAAPCPNPRKVEYEPVLRLLRDAYAGRRPAKVFIE